MTITKIEFELPTHVMAAMHNDDWTAYSDEQAAAWEKWMDEVAEKHGSMGYIAEMESLGFSHYHDGPYYGGCDISRVEIGFHPDPEPTKVTEENVSEVLDGYCNAASWADGDDMVPSADFERKARRDCAEFLKLVALKGIKIEEAPSMLSLEQIGHDFWLTRNHHGAGFWDRGLGLVGDTLTELAHSFGDTEFEADLSDEDREMFEAFEECFGPGNTFTEAQDAYCGQYKSEVEYAEQLADDTGMLDGMPENLRGYFDFEAFARDLFINDVVMSDNGHVFYRDW